MCLRFLGFQRYSLGASLLRASPRCPFEKDLGSISSHRWGQCWKAKNEGGGAARGEVSTLSWKENVVSCERKLLGRRRKAAPVCTTGGSGPFRCPHLETQLRLLLREEKRVYF